LNFKTLNSYGGLKFRPESVILFFAEKAVKSAKSHLSICPKGAANMAKVIRGLLAVSH
jgi:hypothetical protein